MRFARTGEGVGVAGFCGMAWDEHGFLGIVWKCLAYARSYDLREVDVEEETMKLSLDSSQ